MISKELIDFVVDEIENNQNNRSENIKTLFSLLDGTVSGVE